MADMHEAAIELHAALVVACARGGLVAFVHRQHAWYGSDGPDAVAVVSASAPAELWPQATQARLEDDLATGRAAWS